MLKEFGPDIWIADGATVSTAGFRYGTRMVIIRLEDGGLFIWSPVGLGEALRAEVDALGTVRFLVPPNALHHLFVGEWLRAYPNAKVYAPPGLRKKRPDLVFAGDLNDDVVGDWADEIEQVVVRGSLIATEVVFFHRKSGTVLFTDLVQQFPENWFSGWRAVVARLDLMLEPEPAVPRKFRLAFVNRNAARSALRRILQWPCEKVLMAHAPPVMANGRAFIGRAFHWLTG
ncbi:MAG: DUF4336 domain-containing protein [Micropepsaceae bacterium]